MSNDAITTRRGEPPTPDIREFPCGCVVEVGYDLNPYSGFAFQRTCLNVNPSDQHGCPDLEADLAIIAEDLRRAGLHDATVIHPELGVVPLDRVVTLRITPDVALCFDYNLDGNLRYKGLDPR